MAVWVALVGRYNSVQRAAAALIALLLLPSCGTDPMAAGPQTPQAPLASQAPPGPMLELGAPQSPNTPAAAQSQSAAPQGDARVRVEAVPRGIAWGKPPLKTHLLDVTVQNLAPEPRWIALAETFPYEGSEEPRIGQGKVAELQVFELSRAPRVVVVLTVATGGVWALRLPAEGTVMLRKLRIDSWWQDVPATAELEVVSAREILLGSRPMATCIAGPATSEAGADVEAPEDAADPRIVRDLCLADDESVAIEFVDAQRARIRVHLGSRSER